MEEETLNETFKNEVLSNPFVAEDLAYFITFVIGVLADCLIAYCILRFKKMRTNTNLCVLHWSAANCLGLVSQSRSYKLMAYLFNVSVFNSLLCYTLEFQAIFHTASAVFMLILSLDCAVEKYSSKLLNIVFGSIWGIVLILLIITGSLCACGHYVPYNTLFFTVSLFLLLVTILVKNCIYNKEVMQEKNIRKRKLRFTLVCGYITYWLIIWIALSAHVIWYNMLLKITHFMIFFLAYMYSVFNFGLLVYFDRNFKLCLLQTLRCSNKYVDGTICYKEELEEEEEADDLNDNISEMDLAISSNNETM